jgi:hypothetical protein
MNRRNHLFCGLALVLLIASSASAALDVESPLQFFKGTTESVGTLKVTMHKTAATHTVSRGEINTDGSLTMVQQVFDEGRPPRIRRWLIREVSPDRFIGTMSEAVGPVTIEHVAKRYRMRFKISGGISVEQWISPRPDGKSATTTMTARKLGFVVASSTASLRKLS